jgi:hypothetical protein
VRKRERERDAVNKLLASRELVYIPVLGQAIVGESGPNAAHDLGLELAHP